MSYGSTRYDGNAYSTLNRIRKLKSEPDTLQQGSDGDLFSPEEIRDIIANVKEASARLGEQATLEKLSLIRDLRKKLEELTEAVVSKSTWDRRFRTSNQNDRID
jgi:hypothetical protein